LGEADPAVGKEVSRLDLADGVLDQLPKFLSLLLADGGVKVLDFDQTFANEHDLGDVRDAGKPGVAN